MTLHPLYVFCLLCHPQVYHLVFCSLAMLMLRTEPRIGPDPVTCNQAIADGIGNALRVVLEGRHGMHKGGFTLIHILASFENLDDSTAARRTALASAGLVGQLCKLILSRTVCGRVENGTDIRGGRTVSQWLEDNPELDLARSKHRPIRESQHSFQAQVLEALVYLHFGADGEARARRLVARTPGSPVEKAITFIVDCVVDSEADVLGSGPELQNAKTSLMRMNFLLMIDTAVQHDGTPSVFTDASILRAMHKIVDGSMGP